MKDTDRDELLNAVLTYGLEELAYASEEFLRDREFILEIAKEYEGSYQDVLEYVSLELRNDESFIQKLEELKREDTIIMDASYEKAESGKSENPINAVSEGIPLDSATIKKSNKAVKILETKAIELAKKMKNMSGYERNKEVVLEVVREDGLALQYASKDLRGDKEVVLEAVRQNGRALQYASEDLRGDKEVVLEAVREDGYALQYASEELRGNKETVLEAVKQDIHLLQWASNKLLGDKQFIFEMVRQYGWLLRYASEELKGNKEVVLEAVKQNGRALYFANEELRGDKEVVLEAVREDGYALQSASEELRRDKEVVLEAVRQNGHALQYTSEELRGDKEVVVEAARTDIGVLKYLHKAEEIAQGIKPTESAIQQVQNEMIAEQKRTEQKSQSITAQEQ